MKNLLTIGISTVNKNYSDLLERLNNILAELPPTIDILIVNQNDLYESIESLSSRVSVIYSKSKGLSKSRNLLLQNCGSRWLWIQDDDLEIDVPNFKKLLLSLEGELGNLILGQVGSLENRTKKYKDYSFHNQHKVLNALKISSIEIIVNCEFIRESGVRFNENLGLGSPLPCCEENLFIWDCFNVTNDIRYESSTLCYHTTLLENRNIDIEKNTVAKGFFLSFLPLYYSVPIFIRWTFKFTGQQSLYSTVKSLLKGILLGVKN